MTFRDLINQAIRNLFRRRTRTFLTVLGVVIGTASIIVMMSLGLGMNRGMVEMYEGYGSLTTVEVYSYASDGNTMELTDQAVAGLRRMDHVTGVSPVLSVSAEAKCGSAQASLTIFGVTREYLEQIPLGAGRLPDPASPLPELIYGNMASRNFYEAKHSSRGVSDYKEVEVDPMKDTVFYLLPQPQSFSSGKASVQEEKPPKKYLIPAAGVVAGGPDDYSDYSFNVYCDIENLKPFLKGIYKKALVPSPRTNKKGKPVNYYVYDRAYVFVDKTDNVTDVQNAIIAMGYQATSNMQWLEQSQKTTRMVEAVLGAIGAVSLLVAAIGIVNTMMMSIYERTREIGVMKVLGCDMNDIRNLFLMESGTIGFIGGLAGIIISLLISVVINRVTARSDFLMLGSSAGISYIPIWLIGFSQVFAIGIGTIAGYLPAKRAMQLSPLAALRNDG